MPYTHAGEIGDIWKHLPLCDILKTEMPPRYHESNSAYSGYNVSVNPRVEYGILKMLALNNKIFIDSEYYKVLQKNGINDYHYTGSPGLAMNVLSDKSHYFFHDLEQEALNDITAYSIHKGLHNNVKTFCGDSIRAFLDDNYFLDESDFVFLDPYAPFDKNELGFDFFDIFEKAIKAKSKTLLWYGYENLNDQRQILERLKELAKKSNVKIGCFDVWQKSMDIDGCEINPGVPGCGLACAHLSDDSVRILKNYMKLVEACYLDATYCGKDASLLTAINEFS